MNSIMKNGRKIKKNLEANIYLPDSGPALWVNLTYEELECLVSFFAGLLDEHIDAIFLTAVDDEFLTSKRAFEFADTQRIARMVAEAFAPAVRRGRAA